MQKHIQKIEELKSNIFNTGVVFDIKEERLHYIVVFSESLQGLSGIQVSKSAGKAAGLNQALNKIRTMLNDESLFITG